MLAYLCRKCDSCSSEFILEQMEDPGSGQSRSPVQLIGRQHLHELPIALLARKLLCA
jgi:hypothetical protein